MADEREHIVRRGDLTLCQLDGDLVSVAMFIDDADCPTCLAIDHVLHDRQSQVRSTGEPEL